MNAVLRDIAVHLPETEVTNADLAAENPAWDMNAVEGKAGVVSRRIAAAGETALDLSKIACAKLLRRTNLPAREIGGLICCTQSPDYIMPANSHLLHRELELEDGVPAFDFNLACSGYVYGLAMAGSLIESGLADNILFITADTYSKYIHPKDRSARVLFGDGAAVSLISREGKGGRIAAAKLCTHGKEYDKFYIPAGGQRLPSCAETRTEFTDRNGNTRTAENIHMDGLAVWSFINSAVPAHLTGFLKSEGLALSDVDLFVFHQASKMTLDSLTKVLGVAPEKVFVDMAHTGNLVSASIPAALSGAMQAGLVKAGQTVLLCGFGVGLSYGSVLLRWE